MKKKEISSLKEMDVSLLDSKNRKLKISITSFSIILSIIFIIGFFLLISHPQNVEFILPFAIGMICISIIANSIFAYKIIKNTSNKIEIIYTDSKKPKLISDTLVWMDEYIPKLNYGKAYYLLGSFLSIIFLLLPFLFIGYFQYLNDIDFGSNATEGAEGATYCLCSLIQLILILCNILITSRLISSYFITRSEMRLLKKKQSDLTKKQVKLKKKKKE